MSTLASTLIRWLNRRPLAFLLVAAALWWGLYQSLIPASEAPLAGRTEGVAHVMAAALGTVLAFMMSVIARSLPELIILRKVLKVRLIATFVAVAAVVAGGILLVGFVFNAVL